MTETNINKPNHLSSASTASNFVKIFFKYTVLEEMWKFKDNIKKEKKVTKNSLKGVSKY